MPRPLIATINTAAMDHNLCVARSQVPQARAWAVVKANAYGHGLARAMRGFADADGLALIEPEAAAQLRAWGWQKPILLLEGCFDSIDMTLAAEHRIAVAVHCEEQVRMLELLDAETRIDVHLKMNSGMNRLGFAPERYRRAYERLCVLPVVGEITHMTHFANADDEMNAGLPMRHQLDIFRSGSAGLPGARSLANSAADLLHPGIGTDWIRPGIMLYGGTPGSKNAAEFGLRPAMRLHSELISVQDVCAGAAVGYGSRFIAPTDMRIGVVACGYADGYPRHAPDGTPVLVDGVRCAIAGRVSMDMITVDLGPAPAAHIGSKVELWGESLPIDEVATWAGTIGYELMCALAPRVKVVEMENSPT